MKHSTPGSTQSQRAAEKSGDSADVNEGSNTPEPAVKEKPGLRKLLVQLFFIGLASPFLQLRDPMHGLIGLVILFVGLRIAYSMTAAKPLEVEGPYTVTA